MATSKPKLLTLKQRKFVEALPLSNSATEAAIKAGYSSTGESPMVEASRTLRIAKVAEAIEKQQQALNAPGIANAVERKTWLSKVLRKVNLDEPQPVQAGLAASDQLNRMESLYITKSISTNVNLDLQAELTQTFSLDELRALLNATKS